VSDAGILVDAQAQLGECPLWCERDERLYWTDIDAATLTCWHSRDNAVHCWSLPARVGSFALCERSDLLLLGLESGVALFDLRRDRLGLVTPVETDVPTTRINDGRCDPQGRFVFGTFDESPRCAPVGHFYRVDGELNVERLPLPASAVANSLAFSPDGSRLYFADSPRREILCADYHADGRIGAPERFARIADGEPDGSAVDADGRLWTAIWAAGCVVCHDDSGREVDRIDVPTTHPTCPAFGGRDLDRLFVTSARKASPDEPAAGAVLFVDGVGHGRPEHRFVTAIAP